MLYALSLRALARLSAATRREPRERAARRARRCSSAAGTSDAACSSTSPAATSAASGLDVVGAGAARARRACPRRSGSASSRSTCCTRGATAPLGIPSVSMEEPSLPPALHRFRSGAARWINTAWLLVAGAARARLRRRGRPHRRGARRGGPSATGFREYYHPLTGGRPRRPWLRLVDARRRPGGRARRGDVIFTGACDRPHRSPSSSRRWPCWRSCSSSTASPARPRCWSGCTPPRRSSPPWPRASPPPPASACWRSRWAS